MTYLKTIQTLIKEARLANAIKLFIAHENEYTIFNGAGLQLEARLNQMISDYHKAQLSEESKIIITSQIGGQLLKMVQFIKQYKTLKDEFWKDKDLNNYKKSCLKLYNTIKIIGVNQPVNLQSIFVELNTIKPKELIYENWLSSNKKDVININLVSQANKYVLLGKPGSGKTTYLKYILLKNLEDKSSKLPLFINLKLWSESKYDLLNYIEQIFCNFAKTNNVDLFKQLLLDGHCLILLDGLDEVMNQDETRVKRQINEFIMSYSSNAFIITCRTGVDCSFDQFIDIEIDGFTLSQTNLFIKNYFRNTPQKAIQCSKKIQSDKKLQDLASTPILLSLLCILYDGGFPLIPQNKLELYEKAIELLLKKIDITKSLNRIDLDKKAYHIHKNNVLMNIAFQMFEKEQIYIKRAALINLIELSLKNLIIESKLRKESENFLQLFIIQGIITIQANNKYSFNHLVFQEFFAAKYIIVHENEFSKKELIAKYAINGRWKEVFLLTTSLLIPSDKFFKYFIEHNYTYFQQNEKFRFLVDILSNCCLNELSYEHKIICKIINLSTIIEFDSTQNTEHHFLLKTRLDNTVFSIFKILKLDQTNNFKTIEQQANTTLNLNKLSKHLLNLDDGDLDKIENYIISIHRMVQCLEVANVSESVRQKVINSVLNLSNSLKPSFSNLKDWRYLLHQWFKGARNK